MCRSPPSMRMPCVSHYVQIVPLVSEMYFDGNSLRLLLAIHYHPGIRWAMSTYTHIVAKNLRHKASLVAHAFSVKRFNHLATEEHRHVERNMNFNSHINAVKNCIKNHNVGDSCRLTAFAFHSAQDGAIIPGIVVVTGVIGC
jgi:hypothetical protein